MQTRSTIKRFRRTCRRRLPARARPARRARNPVRRRPQARARRPSRPRHPPTPALARACPLAQERRRVVNAVPDARRPVAGSSQHRSFLRRVPCTVERFRRERVIVVSSRLSGRTPSPPRDCACKADRWSASSHRRAASNRRGRRPGQADRAGRARDGFDTRDVRRTSSTCEGGSVLRWARPVMLRATSTSCAEHLRPRGQRHAGTSESRWVSSERPGRPAIR